MARLTAAQWNFGGTVLAATIGAAALIYAKNANTTVGNIQGARLPVGSIVASILDPGAFARAVGDPPNFDPKASMWTLADDKGKLPGTAYAHITENAPIPDLRGVVLRGKNNGRPATEGNVAGELGLGQYQPDSLQQHTHEFNRTKVLEGEELYALGGGKNDGSLRAPTNFIIDGRVSEETRARNVTVNYYIRIN